MVTLGETAEEPHGWQVPVRCPGEEACLVLAPVSVTESQADHALSVGLLFHWTVGPPDRNRAVVPVSADLSAAVTQKTRWMSSHGRLMEGTRNKQNDKISMQRTNYM